MHIQQLSKSEFKAHALEVLRTIERSGQPVIITDRGRPTIEIRKVRQQQPTPLELLKGSVIKYQAATDPVAIDDWENA
jgi:prevent-host-death family protein